MTWQHPDTPLVEDVATLLDLRAEWDMLEQPTETGRWILYGRGNRSILVRTAFHGMPAGAMQFAPRWRVIDGMIMSPGMLLDQSVVGQHAVPINVSKRRGAVAIASDVKRRLLSHYERLYPLVERAIEKRTEERQRAHNTMRTLAAMVGDTQERDFDIGQRAHFYKLGGTVSGHLQLSSTNEVYMDLRGLPVPLAQKIIGLIKSNGAAGEG